MISEERATSPKALYSVWCEPLDNFNYPVWFNGNKPLPLSRKEATALANKMRTLNKSWSYSVRRIG